ALVLARDRQAPLSTVRQLFDRYQERALSPLPLIQLAAAFQLMGDAARMEQAVELAQARGYGYQRHGGSGYWDEWLGDYGSAVRDYALAYALAAKYQFAEQGRVTWLAQLDSRLQGRSYLSTQEQMALVLAAGAAGGDAGQPWAASLATAAGRQDLTGAADRSVALRGADVAALQLTNTGTQPLFAELDLQGTRQEPPAPRSDAIRLQRSWYTPDGRPWDGGVLHTGDLLVVKLRVSAN